MVYGPAGMKKKILSAVLAVTLIVTSAMPAFATPNEEVIQNQQKYEELTKKLDDITAQVVAYNAQIEPLMVEIDNNKEKMEQIKIEVENTKKEIEAAQDEIDKTEEVLGKRVRELYKSGGQSSYLMLLFSADSFNDLIAKVDATSRLVKIDKKIIKGLQEEQEALDKKAKELEEKNKEVISLNEQNEKALAELETKKEEQQKLADQAKAEQEEFEREFLAVSERKLVEYQIGVVQNSGSSLDDLRSAITQLRSIRDNQIKSSIVIDEINEYIEIAKEKVAQKEAEIQAANQPSRGEGSASSNSIINYAYQFIGTPYVWGGTTPAGFDCSGFTSYVYRNAAGIEITRTTYSQMRQGVSVSYNDLQVGDLVFTYGGDHVGIYVGGGSYIHAPQPGDSVKVSPVTSFYCARRIL